jgi:hypothetical protein
MSDHNTIYVGVDNGLDGGLVALRGEEICLKTIMPTRSTGKGRQVMVSEIDDFLKTAGIHGLRVTVILENASKHSPGTLALCSTWDTFGSIRTLLEIRRIRHEIVNPQKWQKQFWTKPKMPKSQKFDTKAAALTAANKLWPNHDWTKSDRAYTPHDGMVDAALLAEYGRRNNL